MNIEFLSHLKVQSLQRRTLAVLISVIGGLVSSSPAFAQLPQIPVFLKEPTPPNLILTVDNSGSMAWAYVPDAPAWNPNQSGGGFVHNALLAVAQNPLAYDPQQVYSLPRNADGTIPPITFTDARRYGVLDSWANVTLQRWNANNSALANIQVTNKINLATQYRPTIQVQLVDILSETVWNVPERSAYYTRLRNAAGAPGCTVLNPNTSACYEEITIPPEQQQNFANWYSFYRTRHLTLKTGMMRALMDLDATTRVTWQAFPGVDGNNNLTNRCNLPGVRSGICVSPHLNGVSYDNQLGAFSGTKRTALFKWLKELETSTSTPLRVSFGDVLTYTQSLGGNKNNPWGDKPGNTEAPINACRDTYHVAVTDGLWNGPGSAVAGGNQDNSAITLPDGRSYSPRAPYKDNVGDRVADLAFRAWAVDASSAANTRTPYAITELPLNTAQWSAADYWNPRNDPATWQHVNTYTIGLGLSSFLTNPAWKGSTFESGPGNTGFAGLESGAVEWPATGNNQFVYDLWHAAVNGRGDFFSADQPDDIYSAFQSIFGRISGRSGSASGSAATSSFVTGDTAIFSASYKSGEWTGTVSRVGVNADGSLGSALDSESNATNRFDVSKRMIFTRNLGVPASDPSIEFKWSSLNAASRDAVTNGSNDVDLVNYLRGERKFEFDQPTCMGSGTCKFRKRVKLLGDILGSSPVYSKRQDFGYRSATWAGGGKAYFDYLETKKNSSGIVLVGANDGMVHGFDPDTLVEKFAYVPNVLFDKLWRLKESAFTKQAYADGPIGIGDAYVGGSWKTIAVVALGAGGRSISALNVSPGVSWGPSQLLWEFKDRPSATNDVPGDDMGYVVSRPVITRLNDGTWVALFSAGYESKNKAAVLYSVNIETGALIQKLTLPNGVDACNASRPVAANGLGGVSVGTTKSGKVRVYAGDLYGRLWRFENAAGSNQLVVAYNGEPLLKACNADNKAQPITAAPGVDSRGAEHIVFAGTGKMIMAGDATNNDVQSFYAVISDTVAPTASNRTTRLWQRTASTVGEARTVSTEAINLVQKRGWFIDLPDNGERVTASPSLVDGRVLFATFTPQITGCTTTGDSWAFNLDALEGSAPTVGLFDVNSDGVINDADKVGGSVFASAMRFDGTITGFTVLKRVDRIAGGAGGGGSPAPGLGGGAGLCGSTKMKAIAQRLYQSGVQGLCTPSSTMRSGWRQLR